MKNKFFEFCFFSSSVMRSYCGNDRFSAHIKAASEPGNGIVKSCNFTYVPEVFFETAKKRISNFCYVVSRFVFIHKKTVYASGFCRNSTLRFSSNAKVIIFVPPPSAVMNIINQYSAQKYTCKSDLLFFNGSIITVFSFFFKSSANKIY